MKIDDIEDMGERLFITLPTTKTKKPRSFIVNEHLDIYRKYVACRPLNLNSPRFFFKYTEGKAFQQFIGIHKFGKMPEEIATFLKLPHGKEYTGHCFRRTSATLLVNSGADIISLKQHGGWRSSTIAEGYIEESVTNKISIAKRIFPNGTDVEKVDDNIPNSTINMMKSGGGSSILVKECTNFTINVYKQ